MSYADVSQQRKYQREWRAARRRTVFNGKNCALCGATENLELDHVFPETKISHKIWSWAWQRINEEMMKCRILCRPCHAERHAAEMRAPCGTRSAYQRGCRCFSCRAA